MTVFLYVILVLTVLATLLVTVSARSSTGPEGPVGMWVLGVFAWLCFTTLVIGLGVGGVMDVLPGAPAVLWLAAVGVLFTMGAALLLVPDFPPGWVRGFVEAVPYFLILACVILAYPEVVTHSEVVYWSVALLLAGAGIVGWGLCLIGVGLHLRREQERQTRKAENEREQEAEREQMECAAYEELAVDAPLSALLPLAFSRNERVRQRSRERIAGFPALQEALSGLLDQDFDWAVSYIARVWDAPPRNLDAAFGRMLERQLESWSVLQHRQNAGIWEPNLRGYFVGAKKIQQVGGELRPQLRAWRDLLAKCQGLQRLRKCVEELLEPGSRLSPR